MTSNRMLEMSEEEINRVEILRMAEEKKITQKQKGWAKRDHLGTSR